MLIRRFHLTHLIYDLLTIDHNQLNQDFAKNALIPVNLLPQTSKMNRPNVILVSLIALVLGGCASVKVIRPHDEQGPQGLKVFPPKPYILVARAGDGGKVISVTTLMLPDQTDPHYLRQTVGIGKSNLTFAVENGILRTYGSDLDSKVPEMVKEVGGVATSLATGYGALVKSIAEAGKIDADRDQLKKQSKDTEKIDYVIEKIQSAGGVIVGIINSGLILTDGQKTELEVWGDTLNSIERVLKDPNIDLDQALLDEFATKLSTIATDFEKMTPALANTIKDDFPTAAVPAELRAGAKQIASKPPVAAVFELYEVIQDPDKNIGTSLKRVQLP